LIIELSRNSAQLGNKLYIVIISNYNHPPLSPVNIEFRFY